MNNAYFKFHEVASKIFSNFWYTMILIIVLTSLLVYFPFLLVLATIFSATLAVRAAYKSGNTFHVIGALNRILEVVFAVNTYRKDRAY